MEDELETMKLLIHMEYEEDELGEYKPRSFAEYLLEKLAQERINN